jgi:hypothetical protein
METTNPETHFNLKEATIPTHLNGNQIKQVVNDYEPNAKVDLKDGLVL